MKSKLQKLVLFLSIVMMIGMAGCGSDETKTETFPGELVNNINIKTGANNIVIRSTDDDHIKISLTGYDDELAILKDDTLTIDIPMPDGGIHLQGQKSIYIDIPFDGCQAISVESTAGSVTVDNVTIGELSVKTEYGDIKTIGMKGVLEAKSVMGEIITSLSISSEIVTGDNGIGGQLKGYIGDTEDDSCIITLYSNVGKITLE